VCFVYGYNIAGGLLAQACSIVDGVDGDLARLKKMTSAFGGFMDAILDRYADALIYSGLILWTAGANGSVSVWLTGLWALAGSVVVSYTRARIEHAPRRLFDRGITAAASRDMRLFVLMIGAVAGQGFATLIALAALTNIVVLLRLVYAHRVLKGL
jgi:phosphatidylglycerophosphate synthase